MTMRYWARACEKHLSVKVIKGFGEEHGYDGDGGVVVDRLKDLKAIQKKIGEVIFFCIASTALSCIYLRTHLFFCICAELEVILFRFSALSPTFKSCSCQRYFWQCSSRQTKLQTIHGMTSNMIPAKAAIKMMERDHPQLYF